MTVFWVTSLPVTKKKQCQRYESQSKQQSMDWWHEDSPRYSPQQVQWCALSFGLRKECSFWISSAAPDALSHISISQQPWRKALWNVIGLFIPPSPGNVHSLWVKFCSRLGQMKDHTSEVSGGEVSIARFSHKEYLQTKDRHMKGPIPGIIWSSTKLGCQHHSQERKTREYIIYKYLSSALN